MVQYISGIIWDFLFEPFYRGPKNSIISSMRQFITPPILDVCCMTGGMYNELKKQKIDAFGLDLSPRFLKRAKLKFPQGKFVCADARTMPFSPESYSCIIFTFALHDKDETLRDQMLQEAKRVLKPSGTIIITEIAAPCNTLSRLTFPLTFLVELMSGHFNNGIDYLNSGGLDRILRTTDLKLIKHVDLPLINASISVVAKDHWQND